MNSDDASLLRSLLTDCRVLSLGVLVDGEPYVGLVPFAVREDFSALVIHASQLARHSRGLGDQAPFGILIHSPETPATDPLQIPRVSLQGKVRVPQPGSSEHEACKRIYLQKFPQSDTTFSLGDFQIYELAPVNGRLVAGFGRAINLNADHFRELHRR